MGISKFITRKTFPEGDFQNIKANAPNQMSYNIDATRDLVENVNPFGVVGEVVAPAAAGIMSFPYDAIQAGTRTTESDINRAMDTAGMYGPKDIMAEAYGLAYDRENPLSSAIERSIGAAGPLANRINNMRTIQGETDYFNDVDISQPPGTNVGIMSNLRNLFGSSAMADEPVVNVDSVKSAINVARNREALNKAGLMSLDDAGLTPESYEKFKEVAKPGLNKQFAKQLGYSALGLITGNPIIGLIARGLGALAGRGGLTGIRGGVDLRGDTGFDTFRRSTSLADFFQRRRDKKAREAAARRGELKQLQQRIDQGDFGGPKNGGGGFKGEGGYGSSAERGGALHG